MQPHYLLFEPHDLVAGDGLLAVRPPTLQIIGLLIDLIRLELLLVLPVGLALHIQRVDPPVLVLLAADPVAPLLHLAQAIIHKYHLAVHFLQPQLLELAGQPISIALVAAVIVHDVAAVHLGCMGDLDIVVAVVDLGLDAQLPVPGLVVVLLLHVGSGAVGAGVLLYLLHADCGSDLEDAIVGAVRGVVLESVVVAGVVDDVVDYGGDGLLL